MKRVALGSIAVAALLLAGCDNVTVNNKSIDVDNQVDAAASKAENLAEGAANAVDRAGDAIGNKADAIGNGVHINVDLPDDDDNKADKADGNAH
jgi:hypothetical protein